MSAAIETSSPDIDCLPDPGSIFAELRDLTADTAGVTRSPYGAGEFAGLDLIAKIALAHGLEVQRDAAANLVVSLPGKDPNAPAVVVGSHMDSVPRGGNYDGAAGIIAGLLCLLRFKASKQTPPRTIKLIGFRGEESAWFNAGCLGSRALLGDLTQSNLDLLHHESGRSLRTHLKDLNAAIELIEGQRPLIDIANIAAYYELHIEQGPVMVSSDLPVAVVTGIREISPSFKHKMRWRGGAFRCRAEGAAPRCCVGDCGPAPSNGRTLDSFLQAWP